MGERRGRERKDGWGKGVGEMGREERGKKKRRGEGRGREERQERKGEGGEPALTHRTHSVALGHNGGQIISVDVFSFIPSSVVFQASATGLARCGHQRQRLHPGQSLLSLSVLNSTWFKTDFLQHILSSCFIAKNTHIQVQFQTLTSVPFPRGQIASKLQRQKLPFVAFKHSGKLF